MAIAAYALLSLRLISQQYLGAAVNRISVFMLAASVFTVLWGASSVLAIAQSPVWWLGVQATDLLRYLCWLVFVALFFKIRGGQDRAGWHRWWPALVVTMEQALARGWQFTDLLSTPPTSTDVDDCQALVWRTSILLDPLPTPTTCHPTPPTTPATSTGRRTSPPSPGSMWHRMPTLAPTRSSRTWPTRGKPSNVEQ